MSVKARIVEPKDTARRHYWLVECVRADGYRFVYDWFRCRAPAREYADQLRRGRGNAGLRFVVSRWVRG